MSDTPHIKSKPGVKIPYAHIITLAVLVFVFFWDGLYLFEKDHLLSSVFFVVFGLSEAVIIVQRIGQIVRGRKGETY